MTQGFCKFILKITGWTCNDSVAPEKNCVILEAPHTSIWDFLMGYLYYRSIGGHLRTMIKQEAFVFPVGPILRAMGAFPIDRKNPQKMIMSIVHEMESAEGKTFHLVICPEGTRKAVRRWKTGYHTIATACNVPVYLSYVDWGRKCMGRGEKFELSGDPRVDTERIQRRYEEMNLTALHPEGYLTH